MSSLVCWNCGTGLEDIPRPISRHATCPACFNELHCCRLCRHFDPAASMTCHEERADPPLQKENANFCEFFAPRSDAFDNTSADKSGAARSHLDALFESAQDSPRAEDTQAASDTEQAKPGDADTNRDAATPGKESLARKQLDDLFK